MGEVIGPNAALPVVKAFLGGGTGEHVRKSKLKIKLTSRRRADFVMFVEGEKFPLVGGKATRKIHLRRLPAETDFVSVVSITSSSVDGLRAPACVRYLSLR